MRKIIVTALLCLPMVAMAKTSYHAQVNHFALKQGQEWSWGGKLPKPQILSGKIKRLKIMAIQSIVWVAVWASGVVLV